MGNLWHVKNWFRVGHNISWSLNLHTLGGFLFLSFPNKFFYHQAQEKHKFILNYLRNEMRDIIAKYQDMPKESSSAPSFTEHFIWTLWWQGEDNAPPLVRACLNQMRANANGAELVLISKDNWQEYIDIPDYILSKLDKCWISFAQLSDIIRFLLLERYGGLWLDATVYTASPIPGSCFDLPFYSQHTLPSEMTCWVQNNRYHGFIIGSHPHAKLVSFVKDFFLEYWKTHDTLVDYLMIDYVIMLAYQQFPDIKSEIDSLPWSSERLYDMVTMLNQAYSPLEFDKLKSECLFSKLDWHKKYRLSVAGKETLYSKLTTSPDYSSSTRWK